MLTKQERAAIAKRLKDHKCLSYIEFYEAITGEEIPKQTSRVEDIFVISRVILDLCDTSNMIDLPLDKDGKVIHVGDVVYTSDGEEHKMAGYIMRKNTTEIILSVNSEGTYITTSANKLTHKKPITIASLVGEIRRTLSQNTTMNKETTAKLWEITDQIKMLGDSND